MDWVLILVAVFILAFIIYTICVVVHKEKFRGGRGGGGIRMSGRPSMGSPRLGPSMGAPRLGSSGLGSTRFGSPLATGMHRGFHPGIHRKGTGRLRNKYWPYWRGWNGWYGWNWLPWGYYYYPETVMDDIIQGCIDKLGEASCKKIFIDNDFSELTQEEKNWLATFLYKFV
jgi:hypothetical protein